MRPTVLHFDLAVQVLDYVLQADAPASTLIVCATRGAFLRQLLLSVTSSTLEHDAEHEGDDQTSNSTQLLLIPTIRLLALSRNVKIAFCPEISHLRALLSVFTAPPAAPEGVSSRVDTFQPLLAILDMVSLHHGTLDFSAQGLSRTFAMAVEASARERFGLVICECKDMYDQQNPHRGRRLWITQVPMLSGSVRLGGDGSGWAGRTITVKEVARRWFTFKKGEGGNAVAGEANEGDTGVFPHSEDDPN